MLTPLVGSQNLFNFKRVYMKYDKKMIMWKKDLIKNDSDMSFDEVLKSRKN